jgi:hypothetical protein
VIVTSPEVRIPELRRSVAGADYSVGRTSSRHVPATIVDGLGMERTAMTMSLEATRPAPAEPGVPDPVAARVMLILPTSGRRTERLTETVGSVLAQADQPADLVVVAPAAAPEVRTLAERLGLAVVDDPGRGLAAAVNAGLATAGDGHGYVSWLRAGDTLLPGALAAAARRLDDRPDAVLAYGDCRYVSDDGSYLYTPRAGRNAGWMLAWGPDRLVPTAMLVRRSAVIDAGGLDETLRYAMDLDLLLRLRRRGPFVDTGLTLASSRAGAGTASRSEEQAAVREAEQVRRRHLPPALAGPVSLCQTPVRLLCRQAVRVHGATD